MRWRDVLAVRRLEKAAFVRSQDGYSLFTLTWLLLFSGVINFKAATPDGKLVGYVSGGKIPGDWRTWIITLGIIPAHQRRGLGRRLLVACEKRMNVDVIYLTVRESNTSAIHLYEVSGYGRSRVRPAYYQDGETGIEMRKFLR